MKFPTADAYTTSILVMFVSTLCLPCFTVRWYIPATAYGTLVSCAVLQPMDVEDVFVILGSFCLAFYAVHLVSRIT